MIIGFTGTRNGMSEKQKILFGNLIECLRIHIFHHGDCMGSDSDAHDIVAEYDDSIPIFIHPPSDDKLRAFKNGIQLREKSYLERNKDIVDVANVMLATPKDCVNIVRSGTWFTIRYAWRKNNPLIIILPNGEIRYE